MDLRPSITRVLPFYIIGLLAAALTLTVKVEEARVGHERHRSAVLSLDRLNALAERDSTREITKLQGDSLRVFAKQAVQQDQRADALDRSLNLERRTRIALAGTIDSLDRVDGAPSFATGDSSSHVAWHADFNIRQAPYTIAAQVDMPPPPDSAHLALHVRLDTIPIGVQLGCSPPDAVGVRAASVTATSPPWAAVQFSGVEQSPEICSAAAVSPAPQPNRFRPRLVAGVGRAFPSRGAPSWSAFVGLGIWLWV